MCDGGIKAMYHEIALEQVLLCATGEYNYFYYFKLHPLSFLDCDFYEQESCSDWLSDILGP